MLLTPSGSVFVVATMILSRLMIARSWYGRVDTTIKRDMRAVLQFDPAVVASGGQSGAGGRQNRHLIWLQIRFARSNDFRTDTQEPRAVERRLACEFADIPDALRHTTSS